MKPKPNTIQAIFPLASEGEINAVVRLIEEQVIGKDESPKPNPKATSLNERFGTCWACYEQCYCSHEIQDELRQEQRTRLYALKGEK